MINKKLYYMSLIDRLDKTNIPNHVAIIMDGNGRWAQKQGKERFAGHEQGAESVRNVLKASVEVGIKYLTLYAFSTENWSRPQAEVDALMGLLVHSINHETPELKKNGVRLHAIGDIESMPKDFQERLIWSIEELKDCDTINLVLALSYSSRWEIVEACKKISAGVKSGEINENDIDDALITNKLSTKNIPDPDLLIRTSGEIRISNFLLWQIAYSELYFTPVLWPDFGRENLIEAVLDYQTRQRRFGKTSQQIEG
ncbi:MAG: isoprenyl transferase [Draconibacterium sp.]